MDANILTSPRTAFIKLNESNTKAATIKEFTLEQISPTSINPSKKKQSKNKRFERLINDMKDSDPRFRISQTQNRRMKIED